MSKSTVPQQMGLFRKYKTQVAAVVGDEKVAEAQRAADEGVEWGTWFKEMVEGAEGCDKPDLTKDGDKDELIHTFDVCMKLSQKRVAGSLDAMTVSEQMKILPWKAEHQRAIGTIDLASSVVLEEAQKDFVRKAQLHEVEPSEALLSTFTFFINRLPTIRGIEPSRFCTYLFTKVPAAKRVTTYVWYVAECITRLPGQQNFINLHGATLAKCVWPLFPPVPELLELTNQVLQDVEKTLPEPIAGGGFTPSARAFAARPRVFAETSTELISGGELYLDIIQGEDGQYRVDATVVEEEVLRLRSDTGAALENVKATTDATDAAVKALKAKQNRDKRQRRKAKEIAEGVKKELARQRRSATPAPKQSN